MSRQALTMLTMAFMFAMAISLILFFQGLFIAIGYCRLINMELVTANIVERTPLESGATRYVLEIEGEARTCVYETKRNIESDQIQVRWMRSENAVVDSSVLHKAILRMLLPLIVALIWMLAMPLYRGS